MTRPSSVGLLVLAALALAIALGWSLIQVAEGVATLVAGLLYEIGDNDPHLGAYGFTEWGGFLAWEVGGRVLTFGALVVGLVQMGAVLVVAALFYRRFSDSPPDAERRAEPT